MFEIMIKKSFRLTFLIFLIISVCLGCESKKSYKPQSKSSKRFYDLSDKEMKDYAKLRSYQIDKEFTEIATQYLHFMNKYQKKFVFRHKNNFNFRLIDQGPLEGLYVTEVTAVVYNKSGDFIQHKSIGGGYYLMLDYESVSYYFVIG